MNESRSKDDVVSLSPCTVSHAAGPWTKECDTLISPTQYSTHETFTEDPFSKLVGTFLEYCGVFRPGARRFAFAGDPGNHFPFFF